MSESRPTCTFRGTSRRWGVTSFRADPPTYDAEEMLYMKRVQHRCPTTGICGIYSILTYTGREHWHAFIIFKNPLRMPACKALVLDDSAHCQNLRGNDTSYLDDGHSAISEPQEFGELQTAGKRNDIARFKQAIDNGDSLVEIAKNHFGCWMKYGKRILEYRLITQETKPKFDLLSFKWPPLNLESTHHHLFGPPNTGKTQFALAHFRNPLYVRHVDHLAYFDDKRHDGIVIDELSFTHWPISSVINLLNKKDMAMVHIRYQVAYLPAGVAIIFCSNEENIFYDPSKSPSGFAVESIIAKCPSTYVIDPLF